MTLQNEVHPFSRQVAMRAPEGEGQGQGGGERVAGKVTEERGGTGKGSRCRAGKGQQKRKT